MLTTNDDVTSYASMATRSVTLTYSPQEEIQTKSVLVTSLQNVSHIEPFPDWPVARFRWDWAWDLHVYGLGTIFSLSALLSLVTLGIIRKRLFLVRHLLVLGVTLTSYGVCRGIFYLVDPHHTRGFLPASVCLSLSTLAFPCLSSAYASILLALMRLTRVQIGPRLICSDRFIACTMSVYLLSTIIISTTITYHPKIKLLLLLCQSCFVTCILLLCFTFVYGGFKMTQFSKDSAKLLKQISDMKKLKGDIVSEGNRKLLSLQKIARPRLNLIALDEGSISCGTESTASGSEDLEYLNEAYFEGEVNPFTFYNNVRRTKPQRRPHNNNIKRACPDSPSKNTEYELDFSDYETPCSTVSIISGLSNGRVSFTKDIRRAGSLTEDRAENSQRCNHIITTNGDYTGFYKKPRDVCENDNNTHGRGASGTDLQVGGSGGTPPSDANDAGDLSMSDSELCDTGYMADTEVPSPSMQRKSKSGKRKATAVVSLDSQTDRGAESPVHRQCILPSNGATVSLFRIRQGRHLHKALRMTYATTLCAFLCSVLQLYSMFGVYGVLSHKRHPDPWQWLIFQSVFRLSELAMVTCMNITLLFLGRGRHQYVKKKRRSTTQITDQATMC